MEEIYGMVLPADYSDHTEIGASLSPEEFASSYPSYYGSAGLDGRFRGEVPASVGIIAGKMTPVAALSELSSFGAAVSSGWTSAAYAAEIPSVMKAKIASHPRYPGLVEAYIECHKVGAPPEIASFLEEINDACKDSVVTGCFGADPELDQFMESYFELLVRCKSDLRKPFDEAISFLDKVERQMRDLCSEENQRLPRPDEFSEPSSGVEIEVDSNFGCQERELKDKLLREYGGHLSRLIQEFSKKKKKGKLPKEARHIFLDWWNLHDKWPYPTETDKLALAEATGLNQRQINNWFINQRKRHWMPSEDLHYVVSGSHSMPSFEDGR